MDVLTFSDRLDIKPGSDAWIRAEEIWGRVVELEEAFWPVGGDELIFLSKARNAL